MIVTQPLVLTRGVFFYEIFMTPIGVARVNVNNKRLAIKTVALRHRVVGVEYVWKETIRNLAKKFYPTLRAARVRWTQTIPALSPLRVEVPLGHPLHELLGRQREEHAVGGDGYHCRHIHHLLPVADVAHAPAAPHTTHEKKTGEIY